MVYLLSRWWGEDLEVVVPVAETMGSAGANLRTGWYGSPCGCDRGSLHSLGIQSCPCPQPDSCALPSRASLVVALQTSV